MSADTPTTSIADLERLLEEKRSQLQELLQKRERLQQDLDELDAQIQDAANVNGPLTSRRRRKSRVKNETPLRPLVLEILGKNKKGLSLADLAEKVTATGYKSASRNFQNVLYQCVYNSSQIVRDDATGLYRLQK